MPDQKNGFYILLFSLHGLIRSHDIEMGRDADTGGQIKYLLELAKQLGDRKEVAQIDLFTRLIRDKRVSSDYSAEIEPLSDKARIVRIPCGGGRYLRKELLWPHLDEYVDRSLKFLRGQNLDPSFVHGHYADGGYVAMSLSGLFDIPFVFTGHSLGISKKLKLQEDGLTLEEIDKKYQIQKRIEVEESILKRADLVITSTEQEIRKQFGLYENHACPKYIVNPPGLDITKFYPYYDDQIGETIKDEIEKQAQVTMMNELNRFFLVQEKPLILALSRPDKRKNVSSLIQAYGENKELQAIANLAVFLGIRRNILDMEENERSVLIETLLLMDKYDLYGKMAVPKRHDFTYEVPELYRITASHRGVFVNPALTEPFGLTLLEAGACGVPVVATNDGGPVDIIKNCNHGILVDVSDPKNISSAIKKILVDDQLWKKYSMNGVNNVRTHYTWKAHIDRYLRETKKLERVNPDQPREMGSDHRIGKRLIKLNKLIVVDIDNTLIGDPDALRNLIASIKENDHYVGFGVATGRTIDSTLGILEENKIPVPDTLITSVGAEIYYGGRKHFDKGWAAYIRPKWDKEKIKSLLTRLPFLKPQEPETEREFKVSYFMDPEPDYIAKIRQILSSNQCNFNLIYSHESFLDVLPARASKGKALRYLSNKWGIPLHNFLVCGDSGNDEEMLKGDVKGVVVGNFSPELNSLKGKRNIYFSKQHYAEGILDGLRHYRFLEEEIE